MSDLPVIPDSPTTSPRRRAAATRTTRKPTGTSPWPVMLIAGGPKAPAALIAARASLSELVGRTLWLSWRERMPDALGARADFDIVEHDGTLDDFEDALKWACTTKRAANAKPTLIVVDGWQQLGDSVLDWAREAAAERSFWYAVGERRGRILEMLRGHDGPVLLVGRLGPDAALGAKDLAADVDVLAEVDARGGAELTATRTEPQLADGVAVFDVEAVWLGLKLDAKATA
jgi:hypothetical protein